ncbi:MAG: polysaccharide biosynthesis C-terminal domain-containing protein [Clostridia bacterium]|nr:polysaccharide biosynthesis C-terminal domain-containing protein [Clostridia bacterium]
MITTKKSTAIVRDMTQGSPIKLILAFYFPLLIGSVFGQLYNIADTAVVGYFMGESAFAAVGATSSMYVLMSSMASSMNNGFVIITTQAFGAKDEEKLRQSVAGSFILNGMVIVVLTFGSTLFLRPLMRILNTPAEIFEQAYVYMLTLLIGFVATMANWMFASILRAVGNSRTPLYFSIFANLLNIALDILFVVVFKFGVFGVAFATVISQFLSATGSGFVVFKNYRFVFPKKDDFKKSIRLWGKLFSSGVSLSMAFSVIHIGTVIYQGAINKLGEDVISAYVAANKITSMTMNIILLLGTALATFVSQNYGAKQYVRIKYAIKQINFLSIAVAALLSILSYFFGDVLVKLITGISSPQIIYNAWVYVVIVTMGFIPLGILHMVRSGMQAMGERLPSIISGFLELGSKCAGAMYIIPALGFIGASITLPIMWIVCATFFTITYLVKRNKLFKKVELDV